MRQAGYRRTDFKRDQSGHFYRHIGWKRLDGGKRVQPKFRLGRDENTARIANARLEALWAVVSRVSIFGEVLWTEQSLAIAEAIRKHEVEMFAPRPVGMSDVDYYRQVKDLSELYPMMRFVPLDEAAAKTGQQHAQRVAGVLADAARRAAERAEVLPSGYSGDQTTHRALDAFADYVLKSKQQGGQPTDHANNLAVSLRRLKQSVPDLPLHRFDFNAVASMVTYWKNRPASKARHSKEAKPIAIATVRMQLKAIRQWVKWLHRNSDYAWRKPEDVEETWAFHEKQLRNDEERSRLKGEVPTFSLEEMKTLWRYATDLERFFMIWGLNCGFSMAEVRRLRHSDLVLDRSPPHIDFIRPKTEVRGKIALWDITIKSVEWMKKQAAGMKSDYVVLTRQGNPIDAQRIANYWNRLLDRVQRDHADFRRLSFKYLRKTAGDLVKQFSDGETMGVFHMRGHPVSSDNLQDVYSNRLWGRVFDANAKVRAYLAPVFENCVAFEEPKKKGGANLSLARREQIMRLLGDGVKASEIAGLVGVSKQTVHRYARMKVS